MEFEDNGYKIPNTAHIFRSRYVASFAFDFSQIHTILKITYSLDPNQNITHPGCHRQQSAKYPTRRGVMHWGSKHLWMSDTEPYVKSMTAHVG